MGTRKGKCHTIVMAGDMCELKTVKFFFQGFINGLEEPYAELCMLKASSHAASWLKDFWYKQQFSPPSPFLFPVPKNGLFRARTKYVKVNPCLSMDRVLSPHHPLTMTDT